MPPANRDGRPVRSSRCMVASRSVTAPTALWSRFWYSAFLVPGPGRCEKRIGLPRIGRPCHIPKSRALGCSTWPPASGGYSRASRLQEVVHRVNGRGCHPTVSALLLRLLVLFLPANIIFPVRAFNRAIFGLNDTMDGLGTGQRLSSCGRLGQLSYNHGVSHHLTPPTAGG
jgi:hypothetical protein